MTNEINKPKNTSPLIDRGGAAEILGIRPQTLACWASNGRYRLPFVKIGRRVMYRLADLQAFIESNLVVQEAA
jgi:hypothetical protein